MNLIDTQQGTINTWHKELIARMRAIPTYVQIEGLHDAKAGLENAWSFYHSNTKTAWNRFKSYLPFTYQSHLKSIYWQRAEDVKSKLVILDHKITELEQKPKPSPRRATSPDLPSVHANPIGAYQRQAKHKSAHSFNKILPRFLFS